MVPAERVKGKAEAPRSVKCQARLSSWQCGSAEFSLLPADLNLGVTLTIRTITTIPSTGDFKS